MLTFRFPAAVLTCFALLLTACAGQSAQTEVPVQVTEPPIQTAPPVEPTEEHIHTQAPVETPAAAFEPAAWLDMTLTDVRSGTSFKLSDHSGKVVILEMMDPGCSVCKDQLIEIKSALETVGDQAVAVSVDVGYRGAEAQVKWGDTYGANWQLTQTTREFGQALIAEFGGFVLHASATPVIIIDPAGIAHITDPGIKKSATLVELVNEWAQ